MIRFFLTIFLMCNLNDASAQQKIHVSPNGNDKQAGSVTKPLKTISEASQRAMPGDEIVVHAGTYREEVHPVRGGLSNDKRITYRAAGDGEVQIKGSERINTWQKISGDVWKVILPNSYFGNFNPYKDSIAGDWFHRLNRVHHTGAVYREGHWLAEAAHLEDVFKSTGKRPMWFGFVDEKNTQIWAQFPGYDPNQSLTEINVRQTVFYPEKTGVNYITVSGFTICHAATNWAPPTAEQKGAIGTNWSKGWIIENNKVSYSRCTGITLGKYGDAYDNTSEDAAEGYVETVKRAMKNGWNRENIGHHIVRNNEVSNCEQAGIVGSMGCSYSVVENNHIHHIHEDRLFSGYEQSGIKFHGAIDAQIRNNYVHHSVLGIWLDWMTQGTRVSGNLLHDNDRDMYFEVNHGPFLVDNNVLLGKVSIDNWSQGAAFVHNLIAGQVKGRLNDKRETPYFEPHNTRNMTLATFSGEGDWQFRNNVFLNSDLSAYKSPNLKMISEGNIFVKNISPKFTFNNGIVHLSVSPFGPDIIRESGAQLITTKLLGKTDLVKQFYENPDGSPIKVDKDYFLKKRKNVVPGPFAGGMEKGIGIKLWPK